MFMKPEKLMGRSSLIRPSRSFGTTRPRVIRPCGCYLGCGATRRRLMGRYQSWPALGGPPSNVSALPRLIRWCLEIRSPSRASSISTHGSKLTWPDLERSPCRSQDVLADHSVVDRAKSLRGPGIDERTSAREAGADLDSDVREFARGRRFPGREIFFRLPAESPEVS